MVEFFCHYSIVRPPKTLAVLGARILVIFSIQIEFIVYFVSNFVAMATAVGRGRICLTSFNSQIP